jgi:hypothetical protein
MYNKLLLKVIQSFQGSETEFKLFFFFAEIMKF